MLLAHTFGEKARQDDSGVTDKGEVRSLRSYALLADSGAPQAVSGSEFLWFSQKVQVGGMV